MERHRTRVRNVHLIVEQKVTYHAFFRNSSVGRTILFQFGLVFTQRDVAAGTYDVLGKIKRKDNQQLHARGAQTKRNVPESVLPVLAATAVTVGTGLVARPYRRIAKQLVSNPRSFF